MISALVYEINLCYFTTFFIKNLLFPEPTKIANNSRA